MDRTLQDDLHHKAPLTPTSEARHHCPVYSTFSYVLITSPLIERLPANIRIPSEWRLVYHLLPISCCHFPSAAAECQSRAIDLVDQLFPFHIKRR